jgi:hypothetical protein
MTQNNMPPISAGEHPDSIATGEHSKPILFHLSNHDVT